MDSLIFFGETVKSLGENKIGGYLVVFGDESKTDLVGDFFTPETDFDIEPGERKSGYYNHGLDVKFKNQKIGKGSLKTDEKGVWLEAQLDTRNDYVDAVMELVGKGALGLSSGAVSHLVRREKVGNAQKVVSWPIGEWSLTPNPCEPRTQAISLKSYTEELKAAGRREETPPAAKTDYPPLPKPETKVTDTAPTGQAMFEAELAERTQQVWELDSSRNRTFEKLAKAMRNGGEFGLAPDVTQFVTDVMTAYVARVIPAVVAQINDYAKGEGSDDYFYIKSLFKSSLDHLNSGLVSDLRLEDHSEVVVSAVEEIAAKSAALVEPLGSFARRSKDKQKFREETKAGRKLSAATMDNIGQSKGKLKDTIASLQAIHDEMDALMASAQPKEEPPVAMAKSVDDETIRQLLAETLHIESRFALTPLSRAA